MKIRSIAVKELKKFDAPAQITGINDQLNIVSGPNEMGKSTILSALRAAFFSRYSSLAQDIKRLQNSQNLGAPVVKVEFDVNGERYQIRKQFVKQRLAELYFPDGRIFRGDAAEDELQRLISFGDSGGVGGQSADMWNLFWVEQGKSFSPISVSDKARSSLHAALESEVGTVLGGRRGRELPRIFSDQRNEYVTATGRERGEFKKLGQDADALREVITSMETRRDTLSNSLDRLEQHQKDLKRLEDEGDDLAIQAELEEAKSKAEKLRRLDLKIKASESDLNRKRETLASRENEVKTRRELETNLIEATSRLSTATERFQNWQEKESAKQSERDDLQAQIRSLKERIEESEAKVKEVEKNLALAKQLEELSNLEIRLEQAQELIQESRKLSAEAQTIRVTDDKLEKIQSAKSKLDVAKATISAHATQISFALNSGCAEGIEIDGKPIESESYNLETVSKIGISIPERGLISVTPAVQDELQLRENERVSEVEYNEALGSVGAQSLVDAKKLNSRREVLLQQSTAQQKEAHAHLPEIGGFGSMEAVEEYVGRLRSELASSSDSKNRPETLEASAAQVELNEAKSIAERLRSERDLRQIELNQIESTLTEFKVEKARAQEQKNSIADSLIDIETRITLIRSMADLKEDIRQLSTEVDELSRELDNLKNSLSDSDIPMIDARIGRLEEQLKNRESNRWQLREEISRLSGHIESFEGAGIDEEIEQKNRELNVVQSEYKKIKQEVGVLNLLVETLNEAELEAKERFLSPIVTRIKPYLDRLFPDAELIMDEDLEIVEINRHFGESFGNLSIGTQEQIAVLVRLTFASMLVEQGQPATVILDDALVFSDEERMEKMFDILFDISRKVQIIIFTCRKSLFEGLGGKILNLEFPTDV